jgi:hypothetical protein
MTDFGKREIFVNLTDMKRFTKRLSVYISCYLLVVGIGLFIVEEADFILAFLLLAGLIGLIGLWVSYINSQKNYQSMPYLILDENGLTINENGDMQFISWQDIVMIDRKVNNLSGRRKVYDAIDTANREYILNYGLLADKFDEIIVLLKRYAEKYNSSLKFIY